MASALTTARRKRLKALKTPYTPYTPSTPPPLGTYDPALDAQKAAAQRGFKYKYGGDTANLPSDYGDADIATQRAQSDLATSLEDIDLTRKRQFGELGTARTREGENLQQTLGALSRRYQILGNQQTQQQRAGGVARGGAMLAARRRREANQAFERQPIDINHQRSVADFDTRQKQLQEDYGDPAKQGDYGRQGTRLQRDYERSSADAATGAQRAAAELEAFGGDVLASQLFQANQTGYVAPSKPKNEHTNKATGQVYQLVRTPKGRLVKRLPSGRLVPREDNSTMR